MRRTRIAQIAPAEGWRAALVGLHFEEGLALLERRLVVWALIRAQDADDTVVGIIDGPQGDAYTYPVNEVFWRTWKTGPPTLKFLGYLAPGEDLELYRAEAERVYGDWHATEEQNRALFAAGWKLQADSTHGARWVSPDGRGLQRHEALREVASTDEA